jgi:S-adenosylmethionine hydrolase
VHAVLERDAPGGPRLDLTHEVAPGDVWGASFRLRCAWPFLPADAIVLAVVDPGVGTARRAVAVRLGARWLVAPDNGLAAAVGTPVEAIELDPHVMGLPSPAPTFHGRDLFAPAAARLARRDEPGAVGRRADPRSLTPCPLPSPERTAGGWRGVVLHVDRFGNVVTNLEAAGVPDGAEVHAGDAVYCRRVHTYGEAPAAEVVLLAGSSGLLELAVAGGSAAEATGLDRGDDVDIVFG